MCVLAPIAAFVVANAGIISAIGAGVSAYGAYQQAQGQKDAARYNAQVAANNALSAEFAARDALDRGQTDAENLGRRIASARGKQTVDLAASGLDLSSGTPAGVLGATDYYGLEDQRTTANNTNREAFSLRTRGAAYQAESGQQSRAAKAISPFGSAATSLLGDAPTIAERWTKQQTTAAPSWFGG